MTTTSQEIGGSILLLVLAFLSGWPLFILFALVSTVYTLAMIPYRWRKEQREEEKRQKEWEFYHERLQQ